MSVVLHLLAPFLSMFVVWSLFNTAKDKLELKPMGWALRFSVVSVLLIFLALLHISFGKKVVSELLFILGLASGVLSVFVASSLFNSKSAAEKVASFVVNSEPIKWLANDQRGFLKSLFIATIVFMGIGQSSWSFWNISNPNRVEGDFLFCPDVWESPFRWLFETGSFGAIAITLAAVFARSTAEFAAEFVGRGHQKALGKLSVAFAFYGAFCFLLDRYYPEEFLSLLGRTTTMAGCPHYY